MISPGPLRSSLAEARLPHVLLVVDGFPKALGGGERVVLRLARRLPAFGFRVSILTFRVEPGSPAGSGEMPCPVYLLPLERTYGLAAVWAALELERFVREQEVRIVQTFFESSDLWAGAVVRALTAAKLVWNRRDMGILRDRKHRLAYRLLSGVPDRVFAVAEDVRRFTIAVDGVAAERVETVYNGLELNRFPAATERLPDTWAEGGPHIVTVGNVRRVKGHDVLLRAAAEVLKILPGAHFSVAGEVLEPAYALELQELVRGLGIAERVRFLGGVSDLPGYLAGADVFCLPSRSEGFSNAILEAMAAGLPVVATNVGGNAEAVVDGVTGYVVASGDSSALGGALLRLLRAPQEARTMGQEGRERVRMRFSEDAMLRQMAEALKRLLW